MVSIPYDLYESQYEILIILPLWWVDKNSVSIRIREHRLIIEWERKAQAIREDFSPVIEDCFRGKIECKIDLPPIIAYQKIHSTLSKENILTIILPKNFIPDAIDVKIENDDEI